MFYRKNLPAWERWLRVLAGTIIAACGLWLAPSALLSYGIAAIGLFTALTGFAGFCPMCAMLGRKL